MTTATLWIAPVVVSVVLGASRLGAWSSVIGPGLLLGYAIYEGATLPDDSDLVGLVAVFGMIGFLVCLGAWSVVRGALKATDAIQRPSPGRSDDPRAR